MVTNPEEQEVIIPVGECIVVEQIMIPKNGAIIVEGGGNDGNSENFDFKFTIVGISEEVKKKGEIQVGDIPVFAKHSTFQAAKVLEKTDERTVLHTVFYSHDLVAVTRPTLVTKE